MGSVSQVRLKKGCLPTKFECQSDMPKLATTKSPCIVKEQKMLIEDSEKKLKEKKISSGRCWSFIWAETC